MDVLNATCDGSVGTLGFCLFLRTGTMTKHAGTSQRRASRGLRTFFPLSAAAADENHFI